MSVGSCFQNNFAFDACDVNAFSFLNFDFKMGEFLSLQTVLNMSVKAYS